MKLGTRSSIIAPIAALLCAGALFGQERERIVENFHGAARYRVTVTNLTPGQPFSPALIVTHTGEFRLFEAGTAASEGIARIAEQGDSSVALAAIMGNAAVVTAGTAGEAPFFLGNSVSMEVDAGWPAAYLSLAGMLGSTNDAFYGLDSYHIAPMAGRERIELLIAAYDAGSEHNNESCVYVPGPPCSGSTARDTAGAEGVIAVHSGIQGFGDLDPARLDWRNPVAKVTIERVQ